MSHPIPGHSYGENEYPSDSPHKEEGHYKAKSKALKKRSASGHSPEMIKVLKKENPAYYAVERRAGRARRKK